MKDITVSTKEVKESQAAAYTLREESQRLTNSVASAEVTRTIYEEEVALKEMA